MPTTKAILSTSAAPTPALSKPTPTSPKRTFTVTCTSCKTRYEHHTRIRNLVCRACFRRRAEREALEEAGNPFADDGGENPFSDEVFVVKGRSLEVR